MKSGYGESVDTGIITDKNGKKYQARVIVKFNDVSKQLCDQLDKFALKHCTYPIKSRGYKYLNQDHEVIPHRFGKHASYVLILASRRVKGKPPKQDQIWDGSLINIEFTPDYFNSEQDGIVMYLNLQSISIKQSAPEPCGWINGKKHTLSQIEQYVKQADAYNQQHPPPRRK